MLYSVHGALTHVVGVPHRPASGHLTLLNRQPCGGTNPVDAALDASERFLVVANYSSGNVAVLPLADDGGLQPVSQVFELPGKPGPDPVQQSASHPHAVIFDPSRRFVIVPDKGFRLHVHLPIRERQAGAEPGDAVAARGGPRHCIFHPTLPVLYVNNELDSTITAYRWDDGRVEEIEVVSTLPAGESGKEHHS